MCDEVQTYTKRACGWLKEHEPSAEQIQDAYTKMLAMLDSKPHLSGTDTDECLELLVSAYGDAGGSVDDLLSQTIERKAANTLSFSSETVELDTTPLYTIANDPVITLEPDVKRAAFLELKQRIEQDTGYRTKGSSL